MIAKTLEFLTSKKEEVLQDYSSLELSLTQKFLLTQPEDIKHRSCILSKIYVLPTFRITSQISYIRNNHLARIHFLVSSIQEWQTDEVIYFIKEFYRDKQGYNY